MFATLDTPAWHVVSAEQVFSHSCTLTPADTHFTSDAGSACSAFPEHVWGVLGPGHTVDRSALVLIFHLDTLCSALGLVPWGALPGVAGASGMREGDEDGERAGPEHQWLREKKPSLVRSPAVPPFPFTDLDICPLLSFLCRPCVKREQGYPPVAPLPGGAVEW